MKREELFKKVLKEMGGELKVRLEKEKEEIKKSLLKEGKIEALQKELEELYFGQGTEYECSFCGAYYDRMEKKNKKMVRRYGGNVCPICAGLVNAKVNELAPPKRDLCVCGKEKMAESTICSSCAKDKERRKEALKKLGKWREPKKRTKEQREIIKFAFGWDDLRRKIENRPKFVQGGIPGTGKRR